MPPRLDGEASVAAFWAKVDRRGPNECWNWTGARKAPHKYGNLTRRGQVISAHRFAFELANGPLPEGLWALHSCDNVLCCNPAHIYAGTPKQNTADMYARGRASSKLTSAQVEEIRAINPETGPERAAVARSYGVSYQTVWKIVTRRNWKQVPA